jgi:hypothetical protein
MSLRLGAFYFTTQQNVTRVLIFSFSSASSSFYHGARSISLNDGIYNYIKQGQPRWGVVHEHLERAYKSFFFSNLSKSTTPCITSSFLSMGYAMI